MNEKIANVVDVNEDDFIENVIEASKTKLIIAIDLHFPWLVLMVQSMILRRSSSVISKLFR
mgnify:CR=1 FL=1